eukprot:1916014-Prymnesium_polylepis.1
MNGSRRCTDRRYDVKGCRIACTQACDTHGRSLLSVSLPRTALPPFIHAVVIRSCSVPQLCAAESEGAHVGAGEWGHAHRAGKWVQA